MYEELNDALMNRKPLDLDAYHEDYLMDGFESADESTEEKETA